MIGEEIPIQLGGGIRDLDTIERYLDDGVSYVIIGTAAVKNPGLPARRLLRVPRPHHRRPGRQGRQGRDRRLVEDDRPRRRRPGARSSRTTASRRVIYTDIGRDGMLTGVNIEATVQARAGAQDAGHRQRRPAQPRGRRGDLREVEPEGIIGAIAGRALYEGKLDFKKAQAAADKATRKTGCACSLRRPPRPTNQRHGPRQAHHSLPRRHRRPRRQGRELRRPARRRRPGRDRARATTTQGADELAFLDITASSRRARPHPAR